MGMQVIKEKTMFKRRLSQTLIGLSMAGLSLAAHAATGILTFP